MDAVVSRMISYVTPPAPAAPAAPEEGAFRGCASACSLSAAKQASLAAAEAKLLKTKLSHAPPRG